MCPDTSPRCLPQSRVIPRCLPSSQPPCLQVEEKILLIRYAAVVHRPDATVALEAKARKEHMAPRKMSIGSKLNAMHAVGVCLINSLLHMATSGKACPVIESGGSDA